MDLVNYSNAVKEWISELLCPLFYNNHEGLIPNEFEKFEAKIFACNWILHVLEVRELKYVFNESYQALLKGLAKSITEPIMVKINEINEFPDFLNNRINLYIYEIEKMPEADFNFNVLIDKLYLRPLSPSSSFPPIMESVIEYINLSGVYLQLA